MEQRRTGLTTHQSERSWTKCTHIRPRAPSDRPLVERTGGGRKNARATDDSMLDGWRRRSSWCPRLSHRRHEEMMMLLRTTMILASVFVGTAAWAGSEHGATPAPASGAEREVRIDPRADAALHRMSDYLAHLETFRVDTTSVDEKVTTEGQKIQEIRESKIAVKR